MHQEIGLWFLSALVIANSGMSYQKALTLSLQAEAIDLIEAVNEFNTTTAL